MNELIIQCGVLTVVVGMFFFYTEWRIRNYSDTIVKKIDAVMKAVIDSKLR